MICSELPPPGQVGGRRILLSKRPILIGHSTLPEKFVTSSLMVHDYSVFVGCSCLLVRGFFLVCVCVYAVSDLMVCVCVCAVSDLMVCPVQRSSVKGGV